MQRKLVNVLSGIVALGGLAVAGTLTFAQADNDLAITHVDQQMIDAFHQQSSAAASEYVLAAADDPGQPAGPPPPEMGDGPEPGPGGPGAGGPGPGGPGFGGPGGPGGPGRHMMAGKMADRIAEMLGTPEAQEKFGLTDEQSKKIRDAQLTAERESIDLEAQLKKAHLNMREAMRAEQPDRDAVMALVEQTGKLETEMRKLQVSRQLTIQETLTPEQRKQIRSDMAANLRQRGGDGNQPGERMKHRRDGKGRGGDEVNPRGERRPRGENSFRQQPFGAQPGAPEAPKAPEAPAAEETPAS